MSKLIFKTNDLRPDISSLIETLPMIFRKEGKLLFRDRNEVRLLVFGNQKFVVKRYKKMHFIKQILNIYRKSKARKSFENALILIERGISTPNPIAFVEYRNSMGLLTDAYYISNYTDYNPIAYALNEFGNFEHRLVKELAKFVASLHEKGIMHHDLNSTNVMFRKDNGDFHFLIIDINRMSISKDYKSPSTTKCLKNITRFSHLSDLFRYFLIEYIHARKMPIDIYDKAIAIKLLHDMNYDCKKRFTKLFKRSHHQITLK